MSYTPKVGHRVRRSYWTDDEWVDVEYVGDTVLVGTNNVGDEVALTFIGEWERIPTYEIPKISTIWLPLLADHNGPYVVHRLYPDSKSALKFAAKSGSKLIGAVELGYTGNHVWAD